MLIELNPFVLEERTHTNLHIFAHFHTLVFQFFNAGFPTLRFLH